MFEDSKLYEIGSIIKKINTESNLSVQDFDLLIESPNELFELLLKVNKSKIKKLISQVPKQSHKEEKNNIFRFSKSDAYGIIEKMSVDEMVETYSVAELKEIYYLIYEVKPMARSKKSDLANALKRMFLQLKRTDDFSKLE